MTVGTEYSSGIVGRAGRVERPEPRLRSAEFRLAGAALPVVSPARMYVCGITPYDVTHLGHAATFVWADDKLITLDQSGALMIAYPSTTGFKIAAKAPLLTEIAWTPPVLVGTRLYMRDRRSMIAVDLS